MRELLIIQFLPFFETCKVEKWGFWPFSQFSATLAGDKTVYAKAAKNILCAIWAYITLLHLLNCSAVIAVAAEFLAYNWKRRSCEIIKKLGPMWRQYALNTTLWSAVFKSDKHSNQSHVTLVNIQINCTFVSDAPMRLAQFVSLNQTSIGRVVQLLIQTMLWISSENRGQLIVCRRVCVQSKLLPPVARVYALISWPLCF